MVVAPQTRAADIGAQLLAQGRNAIDATVAVALSQGVLDPLNCGIGGFGCMVLYCAEQARFYTLSFHARAGAGCSEGMWADLVEEEYARLADGFRLRGHINDVGYQSIATPGTVAGLASALERFGSVRWCSLVEPAIPLALEGFPLTPKAQVLFRRPSRTAGLHPAVRGTATTGARAIFTRDGHEPWREGDIFCQTDYGNTLRRLANSGPEDFYRGSIGEEVAADIGRNGGFVTRDDLHSYEPCWEEPLVGWYRGYKVVTTPPPSCGITLVEMLQIAERFDIGAMEHNGVEYLHLLAQIMRWAYRDRSLFLGDPAFADVPTGRLLSEEHVIEAVRAIKSGEEIVVPRWRPVETGTTHLCVADRWGNLVSLTHTLGAASGVVTPGLGFQYNNAMNCFNPTVGSPNSIAPGKARVSGMTPAIVSDDRGRRMAIGASGGATITNGVFQVLVNIIDFGMSATEAVSATRIDCQGEVVDAEARLPSSVCSGLVAKGNRLERSPEPYWTHPLVHVLVDDPVKQVPEGGADPRGEGAAMAG